MKLKYAGFWKRFMARIIDTIIILPLYLANDYFIKPINESAFLVIVSLIFTLVMLYNVLFVYFYGRTPGKMILKLKVCTNNSNPIGMSNCIFREAFNIINFLLWITGGFFTFSGFKFLSGIVTFASFLEYFVFFFNDHRKTVHDYLANTVVVDESFN